MLRGLLLYFFGGLFKFILQKDFRKLFFLGLRLVIFPVQKFRINGQPFIINDKLGFFWQYHEIYYREYYRFDTTTTTSINIIDCGANIGLSTFWFAKHYPGANIYSFEADTEIFEKIKKNLAPITSPNVHILNQAVYVKNEKISFLSDGKDGGMIVESTGNKSVEAIDFSNYLDSFTNIDMLKIDIEGAERILIPHIAKHFPKIKNIFIEYHQRENETPFLADILQQLENAGFTYRMEVPVKLAQPFVNKKIVNGCFLQANIFATRL